MQTLPRLQITMGLLLPLSIRFWSCQHICTSTFILPQNAHFIFIRGKKIDSKAEWHCMTSSAKEFEGLKILKKLAAEPWISWIFYFFYFIFLLREACTSQTALELALVESRSPAVAKHIAMALSSARFVSYPVSSGCLCSATPTPFSRQRLLLSRLQPLLGRQQL